MGATFPVVDLTASAPEGELKSMLQAGGGGTVDIDALREQLMEIRDGLNPVLADQDGQGSLRLQTMEVDLTIGLEGQIWFVAKGKGEASLKLTWGRGT
jgi:hypothetical protein